MVRHLLIILGGDGSKLYYNTIRKICVLNRCKLETDPLILAPTGLTPETGNMCPLYTLQMR